MTAAAAVPAPPPPATDAVRQPRALVYGDVDMNLIDGSAIWLQSMVLALARAGCAVTLVLKARSETSRLLGPLAAEPGVVIRRPFEERLLDGLTGTGLSPVQASRLLRALDAERRHDLLVLRGRRLSLQVAADGAFDGRLWTYLTDIPQSVPVMNADAAADLTRIAQSSRHVLCQTEELRCFLEMNVHAACGKCELLLPVVPPLEAQTPHARGGAADVIRLVYTGKFAPRWNTYEMAQLPMLLARRNVRAEMHMVGDKIHDDPADPGYNRRMRAALGTQRSAAEAQVPANGVAWHGGRSRQEAMTIAASCDIGLSWREESMNASLELSTKVLEFGSLGLPVVLNRTPMHENLLGVDYPLFANSQQDVVEVIARCAADPAVAKLAADRTSAAAAGFSLDRAVRRLRGYLDRAFGRSTGSSPRAGTDKLRVGVAGHDLRFMSRIIDYLQRLPEVEVRVDQWRALGEHDEASSDALTQWADVIICEWCGPNAVWYSRHKRRESRLIVRLHRFELYSRYVHEVDISAIDQVVCVSPHYSRLTLERTGWPAEKVVMVPNWVDTSQLDRPKLEGARHHLGIIGVVPSRKRLDLALDVLADLRRDDERYMLFVKSTMPWDHWWIWTKDPERAHYEQAAHRIQRDPLLRGGVVFDQPGPDVPAWLRRTGFVLSTSDDESFHVAPAEGMASRAVPVVRNWPGAQTIYDKRWIHATPAQMAASIAGMTDAQWLSNGEVARQQAQPFSIERVCTAWQELLTRDLPPAAPEPLYELLGTV
jgi:glycosyltransferase involved in cell wall biosynthesis